MSESPTQGRLVKLVDVPLNIRRVYGAALVRAATEDRNLLRALELTRAIEEPSSRVFRVSEEAYERVFGRA